MSIREKYVMNAAEYKKLGNVRELGLALGMARYS